MSDDVKQAEEAPVEAKVEAPVKAYPGADDPVRANAKAIVELPGGGIRFDF